MNDLTVLAYHHTYGMGYGWPDWIAHVVVGAAPISTGQAAQP